jgi:hypothetical protein
MRYQEKTSVRANLTLEIYGGADGVRTHDLRVANAMLSQLSYCPINLGCLLLGLGGSLKSQKDGRGNEETEK